MVRAYYNEIDPFAAGWLRELITKGHIAPGEVDERDIRDVKADDLRGFNQHHFFAGIGVWSYALRLAGWPDDKPVWTGSCPCQPFSAAGRGAGFSDERHLWPAWHWLIEQYRPNIIFGEQVASRDGLSWFDLVSTDLEGSAYTCGAVNLPACGVGAPHIRQRLWFVADSAVSGSRPLNRQPMSGIRQEKSAGGYCVSGNMANVLPAGRPERGTESRDGQIAGGRSVNGYWANAEWVWCRDERFRPVEPGTFPLAHGAPARVGRLRGYGNAINAEAAKAVILAYAEGEVN